jgi:lycopene cyclase domain-containing protein
MKWLYLALDLGSLSVPFIFSFHPKIKFYKKFSAFFPALFIGAGVYLAWDVYFTTNGFWGFNERYLLGLKFMSLPLEEWLFFLCIPFACVFTHSTLTTIYPSMRFGEPANLWITAGLVLGLTILALFNTDKAYTLTNSILTALILASTYIYRPSILSQFYYTFLVMLIPFFFVNGILTGSFIYQEVVWYNDLENLGIRLFTIPIEDPIYALGLILLCILLTDVFSPKPSPDLT